MEMAMDSTLYNVDNKTKLKNVKLAKKKAIEKLKEKLEQTKLELIYSELEEAKINFERKYTTVKELENDLSKSLGELDKNRLNIIVNNISSAIDSTVTNLENGSANAFTKLMTGDLTKTIAKTLGISLAGRTALLLAPTVGTKALVSLGIGGYSLYRIVKNRKDIIKANENNELNNILMELEYTKVDDKYIDTRFNAEKQSDIRKFLSDNNIVFEDTGYRSLRQAMYSLTPELKRGLCELLNNKYGRGIEISERVNSAKKKLNVIASTSSTIGVGAGVGIAAANMINSIDPGLVAGTVNGTLLGLWTQVQESNEWLSVLSGSLGLIGTEVLEKLPWVGGFFEKVFAAENLAVLTTLGATGGLVVGSALSLASIGVQVKKSFESKEKAKKFNQLDKEKYYKEDQEELKRIREKLFNPPNFMESIIIDIVLGYFKDRNIKLDCVPKTIFELRNSINKLNVSQKLEAYRIVAIISENIEKDQSFVEKLKHAGKVSVGMFATGLAVLSVYDIVKSGTFLPELSQKLFPDNNIYTPVPVPEPLNKAFDPLNATEKELIEHNEKFFNQFNEEKYMVEKDGDFLQEYAYTYGTNNDNLSGLSAQQYVSDVGMNMNFVENILKFIGIELDHEMVPNIPLIAEKINELSPEQMYNFYRYFSGVKDDGSELYKTVSFILSFNEPVEKASKFIGDFETRQKINDFINKSASVAGTGAIPLATIYELLGLQQRKDYTDDFKIDDDEVKDAGVIK